MKNVAWLSLSVAVLASGCPGPGGGGGGDIPLEEVPMRLAPAYCQLLEGCDNPFIAASLFGSGDCADAVIPFIEDTFTARGTAAVAAGTVIYHGELVGDCITSVGSAGCDLRSFAGPCRDVFEGTVPLGSDCEWDEECANGYCSTTGGVCPGTCAAFVAPGGACTQETACQELSCSAGVCAARAGAGEVCGGDAAVECSGLDLSCVMSGTGGICRPWSSILDGAIGDPCVPAGDLCDPGLSCVFVEVTAMGTRYECAAGVGAGETCSLGFPDPCPDGQVCAPGTTAGTGTCTALPDAGEPCQSGQCAPGLRCVTSGMTSTCVVPARLGQPCAGDGGCASSACRAGVCASPGC